MLQSEGAVKLPDTLHGILAARIDGLDPEEKSLLQDAAALGKVFWTDALAELADVDTEPLENLLHGLERKEFVRRERRSAVADARQYVFVHALMRDVAYGQIPRASRADRHRRAATWIRRRERSATPVIVRLHWRHRGLPRGSMPGQSRSPLKTTPTRSFFSCSVAHASRRGQGKGRRI